MQIGLGEFGAEEVVTVTPTSNIYTDQTTGQLVVQSTQAVAQPQSNTTGLLLLGAAVVFAFLMAK